MAEEIQKTNNTRATSPSGVSVKPAGGASMSRGRGSFGPSTNRDGERRGGGRRGPRQEKERDGFNESVLDLRRVTRVVAGGKRFRFRATVVIGNGKGTVGVGVAKGADVQQAIQKAKSAAKKSLITFKIINNTIAHEVKAKFSAAQVMLRPIKEGRGLKAGGAVRAVMSLSGVKDITAKCLGGTKNKLTNAMATIEALKKLKTSK